MDKLRKLADASGETMVETLVSILISSLALVMLATVIATSVNIVKSSRDHMGEFYKNETAMLTGAEPVPKTTTMQIAVPLEPNASEVVVRVHSTDEDNSIVFYEKLVTP